MLLGRPGNVKSLYVLDLAANSFSGTLPGQWAKNAYFPNLKLLSLNNNPQLNGVAVTACAWQCVGLPTCAMPTSSRLT